MSAVVFAAVLTAALMHAGWNAVVKVGLDRFSSILLLAQVQSVLALGLLPFFAVPAHASSPWLIASALLHSGYKLFLIRAYQHGDLSQVYPLARGSAPLIVAVVGALFLGEVMTTAKALAVVSIALGVVLMSIKGGRTLSSLPRSALLNALGTAVFTASYTLLDGIGARLSETPSGYTLWMFVGDGLGMVAYAYAVRGRGAFTRIAPAWRSGVAAGAMSLGSYWIAIWAFTMAPIALVAALRETSVLFAMLIGMTFLKEQVGRWRWAASILIVFGIAMTRF